MHCNTREGCMNRREFLITGAACAAATTIVPGFVFADDNDGTIALPKPDINGGKPLMTCLAQRRSNHVLAQGDVDLQNLGSLLWAAWGVNRNNGMHVIPTALNKQQVLVFAARSDGVWQYLPDTHAMKKVLKGDRRHSFDGAGLVLLYAGPSNDVYAPMHIGSMYQNVGLYCASAGLDNCVKGQKHDALDAELPLPSGWQTYISHSIAQKESR